MRPYLIALFIATASCGRTEDCPLMPMQAFPLDISGGVNLLNDPRRIAPNEVVRAQNLVPNNPGVYGTRPARRFLGTVAVINPGTATYPLSVRLTPWTNGPAALVMGESSGATRLTVADITGFTGGWSQDFPAQSLRPWMTPFAQKLYVFPNLAAAPMAYTVSRDPGTGDPVIADFNLAGAGNAGVRAKLATAFRNRFVYAHFGKDFENTLVFSDNFAPGTVGNDILAVNSRAVNLVPAGDGEEIVAVHPVTLNQINAPAQSALLVLRNYSAFLLTGEPDQTGGGTNSLVISRVNVEVGCLSPWTVVNTPYGVIWADRNDVWILETGSVPRPIGTKIAKALKNIPWNLDYRVSAAYHDGFYRLAVYGDGQGPTDFSPLQDQWWLDLRNGAPKRMEEARWWGPQQFYSEKEQTGSAGDVVTVETGTRLFLPETRPGASSKLYGVEVGRNNDGIPPPTDPAHPRFVQYGIAMERDNSAQIDTGSQPLSEIQGTEIAIDLITREFDFDDPNRPNGNAALEKIYDGMEFALWNSTTARLQVDAYVNGGATATGAQNINTTNKDVTAHGFEVGVTALDAGVPARVPQAVAAYAATRAVGTTFQFRVQNVPGYVIVDNNDTLAIRLDPTGASGKTEYRVSVAQGIYDTITAYLVALDTALLTTTGVVWTVSYDPVTGLVDIDPVGAATFDVALVGNSLSYATSDEMTENRRIFAMLGMATEADVVNVLTVTSEEAIYRKRNAMWEFSHLGAIMEVLPRRP